MKTCRLFNSKMLQNSIIDNRKHILFSSPKKALVYNLLLPIPNKVEVVPIFTMGKTVWRKGETFR